MDAVQQANSGHPGVEHDEMNVLVMGACIIGPALARELVKAYLSAQLTNEDRHRRRLEKIRALEERYKYISVLFEGGKDMNPLQELHNFEQSLISHSTFIGRKKISREN